jgi:hypothetical protein
LLKKCNLKWPFGISSWERKIVTVISPSPLFSCCCSISSPLLTIIDFLPMEIPSNQDFLSRIYIFSREFFLHMVFLTQNYS